MIENIRTANLIIISNKKILLVRRSNNDESQPGKWSIPGGTAETDETNNETLIREIKEEMNCEIQEFSKFKSYLVKGKNVVNATYFIGLIKGKITLNEELDEFKWFNLDNNLLNLDFAFNQKDVIQDLLDFLE